MSHWNSSFWIPFGNEVHKPGQNEEKASETGSWPNERGSEDDAAAGVGLKGFQSVHVQLSLSQSKQSF